jgi:hypothetical protein
MDINTAVNLIRSLDTAPRDLTAGEQAAIFDLGQEIGDRISTRAAATPDELMVLDACQALRQDDGPSVDEIFVCVPGGDISARDYLNDHHHD